MAEQPKNPNLNHGRPPLPHHQSSSRLDAYSLLCVAFRILTLLLIAVGAAALLLWLIYQPNALKVSVESAALHRFDLAANGTLYFDLALALSVRNPNARHDVRYRRADAAAFYGGARFGFSPLLPRAPQLQRRKSTVAVATEFQGQNILAAAAAAAVAAEDYKREEREGFFSVGIKVFTKVRLSMIGIESADYAPEVDCYIRVPAPGNATALAVGFRRTECSVDSFS